MTKERLSLGFGSSLLDERLDNRCRMSRGLRGWRRERTFVELLALLVEVLRHGASVDRVIRAGNPTTHSDLDIVRE